MRVLYANHTSAISGAEVSLLDLLDHLDGVDVLGVAVPRGPLASALVERGVAVFELPRFEASFKLHAARTPLGILALLRCGWRLRCIARRGDARVIHANSVRSGLCAAVSRALGGPPFIVHVRDILPPGVPALLTRAVLRLASTAAVANSSHTATAFSGRRSGSTHVAHSPIDVRRFSGAAARRDETRRALGVEDEALVVGVVGQISPWKNQEMAIRAVAAIQEEFPAAVLLLVGAATFSSADVRPDNPAYERRIRAVADELTVAGSVRFVGAREDIPELLSAVDVVLLPSLEEPFGRAAVEAMAAARPVVATSCGGPVEVITHGVDGFLADPQQLEEWTAALRQLARDTALRDRVGRAAAGRAAAFDSGVHSTRIRDIYAAALGPPRRVDS